MNKENTMRIISIAAALFLGAVSYAQQPANSIPIGPEGITLTACPTGCTIEIGTGTTWTPPIANPPTPILLQYGAAVPEVLGSDPAPQILKAVVGMRNDKDYTVTYTDAQGTVWNKVVLALASCLAPTTFVADPVPPVATTVCPQLPNMVAVGTQGIVNVKTVAAPLIAQYCADANTCAPPFVWGWTPFPIVYSNPMFNGDPSPGATKTLFFQRSSRDSTYTLTDPSGVVSSVTTVPALPENN